MKIRYEIIPKLNNLSATEMELFLYMARCQNTNTAVVEGLHYRDAITYTGMCKQSFYNALRGLEEKEIITVHKNSDVDYDVYIIGNECPTRAEWKKGYVNLNRHAFHGKSFKKLKAHEKYLLLEFLKCTHEGAGSMRREMKRFYKDYKELLKVSLRVIRGYLHNLKAFFSIGIKKGIYYITYRSSMFSDRGNKSEDTWCHEQLVKKECNRLHIAYTKESLSDTSSFIKQYEGWVDGKRKDMIRILMACIHRSIEGIRYSERTLENKYVHNLIKKAVSAPENV